MLISKVVRYCRDHWRRLKLLLVVGGSIAMYVLSGQGMSKNIGILSNDG